MSSMSGLCCSRSCLRDHVPGRHLSMALFFSGGESTLEHCCVRAHLSLWKIDVIITSASTTDTRAQAH